MSMYFEPFILIVLLPSASLDLKVMIQSKLRKINKFKSITHIATFDSRKCCALTRFLSMRALSAAVNSGVSLVVAIVLVVSEADFKSILSQIKGGNFQNVNVNFFDETLNLNPLKNFVD